jgi:hypothetical protein
MEFLAALLGALVGAFGGGVAAHWAATKQWKRDRLTTMLEKFYAQAYTWIDAVHPYQGSRHSVTSDQLQHSAAMLSLYAPKRVVVSAYAITRKVWDIVENNSGPHSPGDALADYDKLIGLLRTYEMEMRRTLRLKKSEDLELLEN